MALVVVCSQNSVSNLFCSATPAALPGHPPLAVDIHHRGNPTQVWNRSLSTFENWITILSNLISIETSIHYPCSLHVDHYQPPPRQYHPGTDHFSQSNFGLKTLSNIDGDLYAISYLLRRLSTIHGDHYQLSTTEAISPMYRSLPTIQNRIKTLSIIFGNHYPISYLLRRLSTIHGDH